MTKSLKEGGQSVEAVFMTNSTGRDGRSFVRQYDLRSEGPRSEEPATNESSKGSIYTLVGVALVVIAVVSALSGPAMNRTVSASAQQLRDTQSANEAIGLAYEAVTHALLAASDHEARLTSQSTVVAAVNEAETWLNWLASATGRLPSEGDEVTGSEFVESAQTVLRHIESESAATAEVFFTTRLRPINDELSVILEAKYGAAVRGILEAEATAERIALMAQTLVLFAVAAAGSVVLPKWKNVPVGDRTSELVVPYLRRVS